MVSRFSHSVRRSLREELIALPVLAIVLGVCAALPFPRSFATRTPSRTCLVVNPPDAGAEAGVSPSFPGFLPFAAPGGAGALPALESDPGMIPALPSSSPAPFDRADLDARRLVPAAPPAAIDPPHIDGGERPAATPATPRAIAVVRRPPLVAVPDAALSRRGWSPDSAALAQIGETLAAACSSAAAPPEGELRIHIVLSPAGRVRHVFFPAGAPLELSSLRALERILARVPATRLSMDGTTGTLSLSWSMPAATPSAEMASP